MNKPIYGAAFVATFLYVYFSLRKEGRAKKLYDIENIIKEQDDGYYFLNFNENNILFGSTLENITCKELTLLSYGSGKNIGLNQNEKFDEIRWGVFIRKKDILFKTNE